MRRLKSQQYDEKEEDTVRLFIPRGGSQSKLQMWLLLN